MPAISPVPTRTPLVGDGGSVAFGWGRFFQELCRAIDELFLAVALSGDAKDWGPEIAATVSAPAIPGPYADNAAAQAAGVPLGGLYHNGGDPCAVYRRSL